ncbi:hypothetical protein VDG1235_1571 [Verrucomicrobiia bacterium DG1235]|nr:hypothetical protein VDG1235_1571 [Verrucomicrobiae bacterium DG1235]
MATETTDHLINDGLQTFGPLSKGKRKTIIVLGVGRGGTSLCSKALNELGVFTGKDSRPPIFEDIPLSKALEAHNFEEATKLIEEYNQSYEVWAFKRPTTNDTIETLHNLLSNPIYIVIFRDILAIAQRNSLSMEAKPFPTMHSAISDYQKILAFIEKHTPSTLLLSYEKTLKNPEPFINKLLEFTGLKETTSEEKRKNAINSIQPSPRDYLINTSAVKHYGYLDSVIGPKASGWAAYSKSNQKVALDLFVNEKYQTTFIPLDFREDILTKGLHPTGYCGFNISHPAIGKTETGDTIAIRIKETGTDLRNSPWTITS